MYLTNLETIHLTKHFFSKEIWLKAAAWAGGFGFWLLWAGPKALQSRIHGSAWPGPNGPGLARLPALGRARHITNDNVTMSSRNGKDIDIRQVGQPEGFMHFMGEYFTDQPVSNQFKPEEFD